MKSFLLTTFLASFIISISTLAYADYKRQKEIDSKAREKFEIKKQIKLKEHREARQAVETIYQSCLSSCLAATGITYQNGRLTSK